MISTCAWAVATTIPGLLAGCGSQGTVSPGHDVQHPGPTIQRHSMQWNVPLEAFQVAVLVNALVTVCVV